METVGAASSSQGMRIEGREKKKMKSKMTHLQKK
ncbi:hypothetical protein PC116_g31872 [Phytophthora cactorum]|nr:hypothetical protein PC116_g31872 [Phytophthora cactorum]